MIISADNIILIGSALLIGSILAKKLSYRIRLPALVIFLIIGMLAGGEGILGIEFQNFELAQFIGIVALNFILFNGGLELNWKVVRPIIWQGLSLSILGVFLTAIVLGLFVYYVTDLELYEAFLLGSIVSSTDAAAVFSILRMQSIGLKERLKATLEFESGSNDPMAYFLVTAFIGLIRQPELSFFSIIPLFFKQLLIGAACAVALTWFFRMLVNNIRLKSNGLYPALLIGIMFLIYSLTEMIGGNGFLAVFISGMIFGNKPLSSKRLILTFYDGSAWLMQILLFITLGLLVNPSEVLSVMGIGLLISGFLIIAGRPIAVFLSLLFFRMKFKRRLYISWVGLRGAVPIVFATYPFIAGIDNANFMFNIVFFISITSVLIQGSTIPTVARWLDLALPVHQRTLSPIDMVLSEGPRSFLREIVIPPHASCIGKHLYQIDLPEKSNIAMISRKDKFLTPNGQSVLEAYDMLVVLYEEDDILTQVYDTLGLDRTTEEVRELEM